MTWPSLPITLIEVIWSRIRNWFILLLSELFKRICCVRFMLESFVAGFVWNSSAIFLVKISESKFNLNSCPNCSKFVSSFLCSCLRVSASSSFCHYFLVLARLSFVDWSRSNTTYPRVGYRGVVSTCRVGRLILLELNIESTFFFIAFCNKSWRFLPAASSFFPTWLVDVDLWIAVSFLYSFKWAIANPKSLVVLKRLGTDYVCCCLTADSA